jgi:hypothetical protein
MAAIHILILFYFLQHLIIFRFLQHLIIFRKNITKYNISRNTGFHTFFTYSFYNHVLKTIGFRFVT